MELLYNRHPPSLTACPLPSVPHTSRIVTHLKVFFGHAISNFCLLIIVLIKSGIAYCFTRQRAPSRCRSLSTASSPTTPSRRRPSRPSRGYQGKYNEGIMNRKEAGTEIGTFVGTFDRTAGTGEGTGTESFLGCTVGYPEAPNVESIPPLYYEASNAEAPPPSYNEVVSWGSHNAP